MNSWWDKNGQKLFYILVGNMFIPPFLIWIFINPQWAQTYFLVIGIGIPYIITTAGQLIWYNKAPEAKDYVDRTKKDLDRTRSFKNTIDTFEVAEYEKAKKKYSKAKSLDDLFFRTSGILKMFTLLGAIMFFTSDALDGFTNFLLNIGKPNQEEVIPETNDDKCNCEESILKLSDRINNLEKELKSVYKASDQIDRIKETKVNTKGPKTKH